MISGINGVSPEFYPPEQYPWLYPDLYPNYQDPNQYQDLVPSTGPVSEPDSAALATPPPEASAPPVEMVSVDELLDRLTQGSTQPEESQELALPEQLEESGEMLADVPVVPDPDSVSLAIDQLLGKLVDVATGLDKIGKHTESMDKTLELIDQTLYHPALTTSFQDYTVTEALLLLLLLSAFIAACARMLRGGLSWLRS